MKTNRWTTKAQQITAIGAALDVSGGNTIFSITGSSGSRTITSLSGGGAGQWVILLFGDSNVTVTTAAATLKGNVNFAGANGDTLWLATADGTNWREVARQEVAGTTGPISASTITASGAAALNGGITVDSTAFTVADTSGNVATTGTLTVGGAAALNGGITVDSTAFTVADTSGNTAIAGTLGVTGAATFTLGAQNTAVARTATADGTGTGTIAAGTHVVAVTSSDANHIIVLPAPVVGNVIELLGNATGYELRTSDPATISLNNVTGAGVELAVAASTHILARCVSATEWIATKFDNVGAPAGGGTPD